MSSSDNHRILAELMAAQDAGEAVVLATITKTRGSVPRHAGTKMLVYENGRISGTIGGGELEARVRQEASTALNEGRPRTMPYSLVDPKRGDPGVCGGELEIFIEPFLPPATVFVVGCGHVGQAVANLAHWLGFRVAVTDDRADLVTPETIPNADVYLPGSFADVIKQQPVTRNTFVVVVTRNVGVDRQVLPLLLDYPASYVGVMGSKRRWAETQRLLLADGLAAEKIAHINSPIGLDLNAETPAEIAVSIMAEIIMRRRSGAGTEMSKT